MFIIHILIFYYFHNWQVAHRVVHTVNTSRRRSRLFTHKSFTHSDFVAVVFNDIAGGLLWYWIRKNYRWSIEYANETKIWSIILFTAMIPLYYVQMVSLSSHLKDRTFFWVYFLFSTREMRILIGICFTLLSIIDIMSWISYFMKYPLFQHWFLSRTLKLRISPLHNNVCIVSTLY